jgi:hypothetical protein
VIGIRSIICLHTSDRSFAEGQEKQNCDAGVLNCNALQQGIWAKAMTL